MPKVAIIIPTMNRPDFLLRQLRFYEMMKSPHPVYLSDSSNEENAKKIKDAISKIKNFEVTYQWVPPGKDHMYSLFPLIKEKFCIQMGDDDIMLPETLSDCAYFLENNPDYGVCTGKQVNIHLRKEDYDKPYGIIEREAITSGDSVEDGNILLRSKHFWSDPFFICFSVRRTETEKALRNVTKSFSVMGHMTEFLIVSFMIASGKAKMLDRVGYVMQISDNRYNFDRNSYIDLVLSPDMNREWRISENGLSEFIHRQDISEEECLKIAKWMFSLYLAHQFALEAASLPIDKKRPPVINRKKILKELKHLIPGAGLLKHIYYKFKPPQYVNRPESKYFKDFKLVKDFLENQHV